MITLFRWIRLKQLTIKWKYAVMHELDKQLMNIAKNPEVIEKKIMPYLAEVIHKTVEFEKFKEQTGVFGEK